MKNNQINRNPHGKINSRYLMYDHGHTRRRVLTWNRQKKHHALNWWTFSLRFQDNLFNLNIFLWAEEFFFFFILNQESNNFFSSVCFLSEFLRRNVRDILSLSWAPWVVVTACDLGLVSEKNKNKVSVDSFADGTDIAISSLKNVGFPGRAASTLPSEAK